jgi:hypothetical protein
VGAQCSHRHAKGNHSLFRRAASRIQTPSANRKPKSELLVFPATNISMAAFTAKSTTIADLDHHSISNSCALIASNMQS